MTESFRNEMIDIINKHDSFIYFDKRTWSWKMKKSYQQEELEIGDSNEVHKRS